MSWIISYSIQRWRSPGLTSIKMSLCNKTPLRMFATVTAAIITNAPTRSPSAHASKMSPSAELGFSMRPGKVKFAMVRGWSGVGKDQCHLYITAYESCKVC